MQDEPEGNAASLHSRQMHTGQLYSTKVKIMLGS